MSTNISSHTTSAPSATFLVQDHRELWRRGERMSAEAVGVYLDYSKNRITDETIALLIELADQVGLRACIEAMFRGEKINTTEDRAVLHVALRAPRGASIFVDGANFVPCVPGSGRATPAPSSEMS